MPKLYVKETTLKNADGDRMVTVHVYRSEPKKYNYLIWM